MKAIRIVAFAINPLLLFTRGVFILQRGTRVEVTCRQYHHREYAD
jgi:hypothetical protein